MSDLLALAVAFPILGAVIALFVGLVRSRSGWPVALVAVVVQVAVTATVAVQVFTEGRISYAVGDFPIPYGIELAVDGLSASIALLIAVVSLGFLAYARRAGPHSSQFYAAFLLLVAGLTGVSITGDVFNMYVFLEITGLTAYTLVASGRGGRSAVAALKYLIVGTLGASLFLLGIGYAYIATGTLNMADLSVKLAAVGYTSTLVQAAFAFVVVGLFIKVAVFPLHTWQPDAYAGAPDSVAGLISALVSTVSAYALIRVVLTVFTPDFLAANPFARDLLSVGAMVSIVVGSLLAVSQTEIKRMLAYSSVSQFGLVVAALTVTNGTALIGAVLHLVGHAIMKGGLFFTAGLAASETGSRTVDSYEGLAGRTPITAAAFGVLALSMVGVPPTIGFVAKWYIIVGAFEAQAWPLAVVILASTLLTLAYFIRLVERMYFRGHAETDGLTTTTRQTAAVASDGGADRPSPGMYAAVLSAAVLAVLLGVVAVEFGQLLQPTIESLLS